MIKIMGMLLALADQVALQLDPAHSRHLDVRDQARRLVDASETQEFLGRRKRMRDKPMQAHKLRRRDADGLVVIDNRNRPERLAADLSFERRNCGSEPRVPMPKVCAPSMPAENHT